MGNTMGELELWIGSFAFWNLTSYTKDGPDLWVETFIF